MFLYFLCLSAAAQHPAFTAAEKDSVVERVAELLEQNYVFPDKAKDMGNYIRSQYQRKAYDQVNSYQHFAQAMSSDLQKAHRDGHLNLKNDPGLVKMLKSWKSASEPGPEVLREHLRKAERSNFGFTKVERLPGNIGYINFTQFFPVSEQARQTVAAAMAFVANTDAVVLDMRYNGGGHPEMVQLVMSYFFDVKPIHYNSIYDRPRNTTKEYHTLAEVDGERMPKTDLYVLTSSNTFSAAKELTYNLQSLKRATIVGETTAGGAHPVQPFIVNDQLVLDIPVARSINAITQTNWEGTGVLPDVKVEADKALLKAQELALNELLLSSTDAQDRTPLEWELQYVKSELQPVQLDKKVQSKYAGRYGERIVRVQGNELYYEQKGKAERKLIPITDTIFRIEGIPNLRVEMVKDEKGNVKKLLELREGGGFNEFARSH
ncbi:interphotoreceptor retinoid-binding protein [Pontibacter amylolyticus]|uniref:Interphotoreceptor retinoid-binding protein n=2 Tax=Pontibacter amylolyticus TaxID=1424080 RepID=A0ABQ1W409_9BACT|nr:interphotoreceptor retinoid-binding protein [Pontibacter amylolyticus]